MYNAIENALDVIVRGKEPSSLFLTTRSFDPSAKRLSRDTFGACTSQETMRGPKLNASTSRRVLLRKSNASQLAAEISKRVGRSATDVGKHVGRSVTLSTGTSHTVVNANYGTDDFTGGGDFREIKSFYDIVKGNKRRENPKDGVIDCLYTIGELKDEFQKGDARKTVELKILNNWRLFSALARKVGYDVPTGISLIYPTSVLTVLESATEMTRKIIGLIEAVVHTDGAFCTNYRILHISCNIPRRSFPSFYTKVLFQPRPLTGWAPPSNLENPVRPLLNEIFRQFQELGFYLRNNHSDRRIMETLVERVPLLIPDQDALVFLSGSRSLLRPEDFGEKYEGPVNFALESDITWPCTWWGKRLGCSVNFASLEAEAQTNAVWGGVASGDAQEEDGASRVVLASTT